MSDLRRPYRDKPFAGIQTTLREGAAEDGAFRTYCLLVNSTNAEPGGMYGIPMDFDPQDPWGRGLAGLASIVVRKYGPDYHNKVTFRAPKPKLVDLSETREFITRYEEIRPDEIRFFHVIAEIYSGRLKQFFD